MNTKVNIFKKQPEQKDKTIYLPVSISDFEEVTQSITTCVPRQNDKYDLYIKDPEKPLFSRFCICFPELLLKILCNDHLNTILTFRLVSKELNRFASSTHKDFKFNPLLNKALISFHYDQLHPQINPSVQEKWDFLSKHAEEKIESQIIASPFHDLLNLKDIFILKNTFTIIFKIENNNEFNQLQALFANEANILLLAKLKKLDFSELFIDIHNINDCNTTLATIAQNFNLLKNLTTISVGEICPTVTLQMPQLLENSIKIIYKLADENSLFTLKNTVKGAIVGLGVYSVYRYFSSKESTQDEKKDKRS